LTRQSLPIGATAVLALGLMSFQGYRAHNAAAVLVVPTAPVAPTVSAGMSMSSREAAPVAAVVAQSDSAAELTAHESAPVAVEAAARPAPAAPVAHAPSEVAADPFSALVGSPSRPALAVAPQSDAWNHFGDKQLASNSLASTVGFTPHAFASAAVSEPLAQMATPLDERRAMLLSGSLPRAENATDEATQLNSDDHSASHLSDERLYESVRRLGLGGNRLSIRF
jgi:hypothetical protein